jgi:nitrate reductase gamma subunit
MCLFSSDIYAFLLGPGLLLALLVFAAGCIFRIMQFRRWTRKIRKTAIAKPAVDQKSILFKDKSAFGKLFLLLKLKIHTTIFGSNPVMGILSLIFHILLFATPIFLPAHNILAGHYLGISLPSISESLMDKFTVVLIAFGLFFLLRRIFVPRVRVLSTLRDYVVLILVMAPFISGFNAYHQFSDYKSTLIAHIIISEIAIMVVPFTSLGHMPFFIFSRFFIGSEYNWKPGNRSW